MTLQRRLDALEKRTQAEAVPEAPLWLAFADEAEYCAWLAEHNDQPPRCKVYVGCDPDLDWPD